MLVPLMLRIGPSAKFLAPAKKRLVIGVLQTRFLTLSSSHFDPSPTSSALPDCNAHTPSRAKPLAPPRAIRVTERYGT